MLCSLCITILNLEFQICEIPKILSYMYFSLSSVQNLKNKE